VFKLAKLLCVYFVLSLISGCATYSRQAFTLHDALIAGQLDIADALIEKQEQSSDIVLTNMNKGIVRRMKNDFQGSNSAFEISKNQIEKLHGVSVTEQLGSMAINEAVIAYKGASHEQLLVHAYMAMNYIEMGDLDAARVEMLQADVKMREWGEQPDDDPFIRYLSGMVYEALGEYDQALVAYRYAVEAYKEKREKQNLEVPDLLLKDLLRLLIREGFEDEAGMLKKDYAIAAPGEASRPKQTDVAQGELVVILSNGLAPIKTENSITIFSNEIERSLRIALPAYAIKPQPLTTARIVIDGHSGMLESVENIDALARGALEEGMPVILSRAIARAIVKHKTQNKAKDANAMGGFLVSVTNLVTERADTRSWITLPQEIQMARHVLAPGTHQLKIELLNTAGYVVDRFTESVSILPGKMKFVSRHWVAPRPALLDKNPAVKDGKKTEAVRHEVQNNRRVQNE